MGATRTVVSVAGDEEGDDHAAGTRLLNTGSWVYQPHFLSSTPNQSPYWPCTAVVLDDDGEPPRLVRLLGDRGHAELRPPVTPPGQRSPA